MSESPEELDQRWRALPVPVGTPLEAERIGSWAGGILLVAVDSLGRRHLLVGYPDDLALGRMRSMRGLSVDRLRMRSAGHEGTWIDICLIESAGERLFNALCVDILAATETADIPDQTIVSAVLERWRRFWLADTGGLSREGQLGLIGELWLLLEWLAPMRKSAVSAWKGPLGGRHDFVASVGSIEVKTTGSAAGPVVHHIVSLEQLDDPVDGLLYLLSLHVNNDALGSHTLDALIERARAAALETGEAVRDELDERLALVGWTPADRGRYVEPFRVVGQVLYKVENDFPRLTPSRLAGCVPPGVSRVQYDLDTSALSPWRVASTPIDLADLMGLPH